MEEKKALEAFLKVREVSPNTRVARLAFLEVMEVSQTLLAENIGVTRQTLNNHLQATRKNRNIQKRIGEALRVTPRVLFADTYGN